MGWDDPRDNDVAITAQRLNIGDVLAIVDLLEARGGKAKSVEVRVVRQRRKQEGDTRD